MSEWRVVLYTTTDRLAYERQRGALCCRRTRRDDRWITNVWLASDPLDGKMRSRLVKLLSRAEEQGDDVIAVIPALLADWIQHILAGKLDRYLVGVSEARVPDRSGADSMKALRRFFELVGRRPLGRHSVQVFAAVKGRGAMRPVIVATRLEIDEFDACVFDVSVDDGTLTLRDHSEWERPVPTSINNGESLTSALVLFLNQYRLRRVFTSEDEILAYAVSMPGIINPDTGTIMRSGRFGIRPPEPPVEANRIWSERMGAPVFVFHDGPCLALGEMKYGVGKDEPDGHDTFVFITVGEGIGSTLFIDGKHYRGVSGVAGEFGRIVLDPSGPFSPATGNNGCVEVYTTRPWINQNILNRYRASGSKQPTRFSTILSAVTDPMQITTDMLVAGVQENDPLVVRALDEAAQKLGQAVSMIITFFNPPKIIIGGELMDKIARYYDQTVVQAEAFTFTEALKRVEPPRSGTEILKATLGPQAQLFGSAEQALARVASEQGGQEAVEVAHADADIPRNAR